MYFCPDISSNIVNYDIITNSSTFSVSWDHLILWHYVFLYCGRARRQEKLSMFTDICSVEYWLMIYTIFIVASSLFQEVTPIFKNRYRIIQCQLLRQHTLDMNDGNGNSWEGQNWRKPFGRPENCRLSNWWPFRMCLVLS